MILFYDTEVVALEVKDIASREAFMQGGLYSGKVKVHLANGNVRKIQRLDQLRYVGPENQNIFLQQDFRRMEIYQLFNMGKELANQHLKGGLGQ